jgi:hypothetical protein
VGAVVIGRSERDHDHDNHAQTAAGPAG